MLSLATSHMAINATSWIMLRCQFLCHVWKALFFIKIALKLGYFCKKMQNFRALGTPPLDPRNSPPSPVANFWLRACERRFPLEIGEKKCFTFGKTFFWSLLNLLTWKKSWSRFIPPMLKIGQIWDKIANYLPQCSTNIGTPAIITQPPCWGREKWSRYWPETIFE